MRKYIETFKDILAALVIGGALAFTAMVVLFHAMLFFAGVIN